MVRCETRSASSLLVRSSRYLHRDARALFQSKRKGRERKGREWREERKKERKMETREEIIRFAGKVTGWAADRKILS